MRDKKRGIGFHTGIILLAVALYVFGKYADFIDWPQFLLLSFILLQARVFHLFNMFAVTEGGLLSGSQFIPWKKIKSFQFIPIHINHRFYGHAREINDKYELKVKTAFYSTSCVVLSENMKEQLQRILSSHVHTQDRTIQSG